MSQPFKEIRYETEEDDEKMMEKETDVLMKIEETDEVGMFVDEEEDSEEKDPDSTAETQRHKRLGLWLGLGSIVLFITITVIVLIVDVHNTELKHFQANYLSLDVTQRLPVTKLIFQYSLTGPKFSRVQTPDHASCMLQSGPVYFALTKLEDDHGMWNENFNTTITTAIHAERDPDLPLYELDLSVPEEAVEAHANLLWDVLTKRHPFGISGILGEFNCSIDFHVTLGNMIPFTRTVEITEDVTGGQYRPMNPKPQLQQDSTWNVPPNGDEEDPQEYSSLNGKPAEQGVPDEDSVWVETSKGSWQPANQYAELMTGQPLETSGPQATNGSQATSDPQATDGPQVQATDEPEATGAPSRGSTSSQGARDNVGSNNEGDGDSDNHSETKKGQEEPGHHTLDMSIFKMQKVSFDTLELGIRAMLPTSVFSLVPIISLALPPTAITATPDVSEASSSALVGVDGLNVVFQADTMEETEYTTVTVKSPGDSGWYSPFVDIIRINQDVFALDILMESQGSFLELMLGREHAWTVFFSEPFSHNYSIYHGRKMQQDDSVDHGNIQCITLFNGLTFSMNMCSEWDFDEFVAVDGQFSMNDFSASVAGEADWRSLEFTDGALIRASMSMAMDEEQEMDVKGDLQLEWEDNFLLNLTLNNDKGSWPFSVLALMDVEVTSETDTLRLYFNDATMEVDDKREMNVVGEFSMDWEGDLIINLALDNDVGSWPFSVFFATKGTAEDDVLSFSLDTAQVNYKNKQELDATGLASLDVSDASISMSLSDDRVVFNFYGEAQDQNEFICGDFLEPCIYESRDASDWISASWDLQYERDPKLQGSFTAGVGSHENGLNMSMAFSDSELDLEFGGKTNWSWIDDELSGNISSLRLEYEGSTYIDMNSSIVVDVSEDTVVFYMENTGEIAPLTISGGAEWSRLSDDFLESQATLIIQRDQEAYVYANCEFTLSNGDDSDSGVIAMTSNPGSSLLLDVITDFEWIESAEMFSFDITRLFLGWQGTTYIDADGNILLDVPSESIYASMKDDYTTDGDGFMFNFTGSIVDGETLSLKLNELLVVDDYEPKMNASAEVNLDPSEPSLGFSVEESVDGMMVRLQRATISTGDDDDDEILLELTAENTTIVMGGNRWVNGSMDFILSETGMTFGLGSNKVELDDQKTEEADEETPVQSQPPPSTSTGNNTAGTTAENTNTTESNTPAPINTSSSTPSPAPENTYPLYTGAIPDGNDPESSSLSSLRLSALIFGLSWFSLYLLI